MIGRIANWQKQIQANPARSITYAIKRIDRELPNDERSHAGSLVPEEQQSVPPALAGAPGWAWILWSGRSFLQGTQDSD
jgi:type IV secretory pathway TrbL component